jgi:predicted AlkP superfamily pyrophosphatase or phosphodiesterase
MKNFFVVVLFLFSALAVHAQERPKLVVGIVVDQMKADYLYRFNKHFIENGFKKLMREGAEVKNMHYNYVPTYTGPGHASVYTGTTPALHGIIGNNWYSRELGKSVYCVSDETVQSIGTESTAGHASPHRLLTTTITDELRLSTAMNAKVLSISIKDRGAILPAGHTGQAYWFDNATGHFVTSTYYREDLPRWMDKFNRQNLSDRYLKQKWDRLLPKDAYIPDHPQYASYERGLKGQDAPDFPYNLRRLRDNYDYYLLANTPFGNDIVTEAAKAALEGEDLGQDDVTDFLAVSYSSTDIIGHSFGPQSQEVEDTYYRLDRNIADLLEFLDDKVGAGNYLVFLTADHAVADVPLYLVNEKIPAGIFNEEEMSQRLDNVLNKNFGVSGLISNISNYQLFLDHSEVNRHELDLADVQQVLAEHLVDNENNIAYAWTARDIHQSGFGERGLKGSLVRGYNQKRSGDVLYAPFPGWFPGGSAKGTTHGSPFTYDTHVPMLWYGWKIPAVSTVKPYEISDIAITLSLLLDIRMPNGSIGQPIREIFNE